MMNELYEDHCRLLHPRTAFFLTSADADGKPNVMTCTWATPASEEPPTLIACVARESFTAELVRRTGEFGVSIPSGEMEGQLVLCGSVSGRDTDKFAHAGLKPLPSQKIGPPLVSGCIGHIECRVTQTILAGECFAFVGEIVAASVDERYFEGGAWTPASLCT